MNNIKKNRKTDSQSDTLLVKPWSTIARAAWLAMVLFIMALFAYSLITGFSQLSTVCTGEACHPSQLDPDLAALNQQLGFTLNFYARYTTITYSIFGAFNFVIAWLIFWRRSDDWMALFVSLFLVLIGAGANPVIPTFGGAVFYMAVAALPPLFYLFPNGRFVPRWTRWLVLGWIIYYGVKFLVSEPSRSGIQGGTPDIFIQISLLAGIGSQVYRYRRVSNPLERQQTKWAVFGFAGFFLCLIALLIAFFGIPAMREPGPQSFFMNRYAFAFTALLPILFIPAGLGIAILRYRLWDIDIIIRRTLQYALLTGMLVFIYFSGVVIFQTGVNSLTGRESSPIFTVMTTLAIIVLFNPLRSRIQGFIDRRFYRKKYNAEQALAQFAATTRDEADIESLSARLLGLVNETVQPEETTLWMVSSHKSREPYEV